MKSEFMDSVTHELRTPLHSIRGFTRLIMDDPNAAMFAKHTLERAGYRVVVASDGQTGIEMATSQEDIDLVVLDVMMAGMDGFQVSSRLRENSDTETLPIVMLTAKSAKQDKFTGLVLAEANAYITKPADPHELVRTVEQALSEHRRAPKPAPVFERSITPSTQHKSRWDL